jgi:tetratricopeptide (TPR) repeat protein
MYKLYLSFIFLLFYKGVTAQNNTSDPQFSPAGAVINIAVSSVDGQDGNSYFSEAEKNERRGDLNDALTLFGKAAFEFNSSRMFVRYGAALLRLSHVHFLLQNYTEAEQVIINVALKNYSRIGSRTGQMESYNQLGKIYMAHDKLTESLWFYTQQGLLAKQVNNNSSYIDSMIGIVRIKIRRKEYKLASKDLNRAELLAQNQKNSQFKGQFKEVRNLIAEQQNYKK